MKYPSTFTPYRQVAAASHQPRDAKTFLRSSDAVSSLLPAVTRMLALQKDCTAILPSMFQSCTVLLFDSPRLVLGTPNAALATKLKQQLPKLQDRLLKAGWQVDVIRIKIIQGDRNSTPKVPPRQISLSELAVNAFAELSETIENSPRNHNLIAALQNMVKRQRQGS